MPDLHNPRGHQLLVVFFLKTAWNLQRKLLFCQWLIPQLVEHSLLVMKDPGSNLGADICSFVIYL
jgi:hypothetical protein